MIVSMWVFPLPGVSGPTMSTCMVSKILPVGKWRGSGLICRDILQDWQCGQFITP